MSRLGSSIDSILCEKLKGKLSAGSSYTSDNLIDFFRNDPDFILEDMVAWLFGNADWVGDSTKVDDVTAKLNIFIDGNISPKGEQPQVMSCLSSPCAEKFWYHYGYGVSVEQQEIYKQELCDLFHS